MPESFTPLLNVSSFTGTVTAEVISDCLTWRQINNLTHNTHCNRYYKLVENNEQLKIHSTTMPQQQCHLFTSAVNSHHAAGFNVQHGKGVGTNALAFKHLILWWALEAVILYEYSICITYILLYQFGQTFNHPPQSTARIWKYET